MRQKHQEKDFREKVDQSFLATREQAQATATEGKERSKEELNTLLEWARDLLKKVPQKPDNELAVKEANSLVTEARRKSKEELELVKSRMASLVEERKERQKRGLEEAKQKAERINTEALRTKAELRAIKEPVELPNIEIQKAGRPARRADALRKRGELKRKAEAEARVRRDAELKAKEAEEKAKREAVLKTKQEAEQAKELEKHAKREARLAAKEPGKSSLKEAQKTEAGAGVPKTNVRIIIPQPVTAEQVSEFEAGLGKISNLRIVVLSGSIKEIMIVVALAEPMDILATLRNLAIVDSAQDRDGGILVTLRAPSASNRTTI